MCPISHSKGIGLQIEIFKASHNDTGHIVTVLERIADKNKELAHILPLSNTKQQQRHILD